MVKNNAKYTPQEFINIWNGSDTVTDVVRKTGFRKTTVLSMSSRLRSVGFDLKNMPNFGRQKKEEEHADRFIQGRD